MSVDSILTHHLETLTGGDVDGVMEDYADDAVMLMAGLGTLEGADAIRAGMTGIPSEMFAGFEETARIVTDEIAYVTWKTDAAPMGTDTFVIRDGKIVAQTVAMHTG
jgi:ketosteroid isomerase-like protein